jgi:serine/threonine protein kinase
MNMVQGTRDDVKAGAGLSEASAAGSQAFEALEKREIIDQAYDEYCLLREAGERPDPDEFCNGFPYQSSLRRLLEVDRLVQEHPSLLEKPATADWPQAGTRFLGFELVRELGRGAFARVFVATQPALGQRRVAVKIALHGAAEAETLGRLDHPNIVSVHSVEKDEATGLTAVCMPYLGGSNLCHLLDRLGSGLPATAEVVQEAIEETRSKEEAPLPKYWTRHESYVDAVAEIGEQLANGLANIHAQGICHRDLKPSNVLLAANGRAMLLDFNLSFDAKASEQRLGGTLPYMSPEHLRATDVSSPADPSSVDARSDIFSLGVLLYELLTGSHPFGAVPLKWSAEQVREHLRRGQLEGPRPLRSINPRVNKALARVIESCLAHNPNDRPQSAADLSASLRRTRPLVGRIRRWTVGHARFIAAASILALAAGAVGGFGTYSLPAKEPNGGASEADVDHAKIAGELYSRGAFAESAREYGLAVKADPKNPELLFASGRAFQQAGDRIADGNREDNLSFALNYYRRADAIVAPDLNNISPKARPLHGRICACIAYCLSLTGQQPMAIEKYLDAKNAGFENERIHNNLGYCYQNSGKLGEAEKELKTALSINPQLRAAYYNRAVLNGNLVTTTPEAAAGSPLDDIDQTLGMGAPTGRLCRDAARLHAIAAREHSRLAGVDFTDGSGFKAGGSVFDTITAALAAEKARVHRERAIQYLTKALQLGQNRTKIEQEDRFLGPLTKGIANTEDGPAILEPDLRVVDPIGDANK